MSIIGINNNVSTNEKNINNNCANVNNNNEPDTKSAITKYLNGVREYISKITDPLNGMTEEQKQKYKNKIMRLIESGKKLTNQQMQYIKKYMPEMYPYVLRIQIKKKAFEENLKHCKSKEEANDKYNEALSQIDSEEPMAKAMIAAYDDSMKKFKKSEMYKALPATNKEAKEKYAIKRYKDPFQDEDDNSDSDNSMKSYNTETIIEMNYLSDYQLSDQIFDCTQ